MIEFRQHRIQYQQDMTQMSKRRRMTTNSAKSWAKNAPQCWGYENARVYSPQQLTYIQRANLSTVVCKGGVCVLEMVNTHTHKPEDIFQVPTAIPGAYIRKRRGGSLVCPHRHNIGFKMAKNQTKESVKTFRVFNLVNILQETVNIQQNK